MKPQKEAGDWFNYPSERFKIPTHVLTISPDELYTAIKVRTEDGCAFARQDGGTWSDGDITYASLQEMDVDYDIIERDKP